MHMQSFFAILKFTPPRLYVVCIMHRQCIIHTIPNNALLQKFDVLFHYWPIHRAVERRKAKQWVVNTLLTTWGEGWWDFQRLCAVHLVWPSTLHIQQQGQKILLGGGWIQRWQKRPRLLKHVHKITNIPLLYIGIEKIWKRLSPAQNKAAVD